MKKEKYSWKKDWQLLIRGIRLWGEICPQFLIYNTLYQIAEMIIPYFPLYLSAQIVNELSGSSSARRLLVLATAAVVGTFGLGIMKRILEGRREVWRDCCFQRTESYLADRQNGLEYRHIEDPDVALLREEINNAAITGGAGLWRIVWVFPGLVGNLFDLAISASLTISMFHIVKGADLRGISRLVNSPVCGIAFVLLLVLAAAVSIKSSSVHTSEEMAAWSHLAKDMVSVNTYIHMHGEDITIFNLKDAILKEYEKVAIRPPYFAAAERANRKYRTITILQDAVLTAVVFLITAAKAFTGVFGIGSFILYQGTVKRFVKALCGIAGDLTNFRENSKYLIKLYQFLDLPDDMYHGSLAVEKRDDIDYEIEFRNVGFRYPGSEVWALRNVSMKFKVGDKLAIVGENGSGKTTFIKLLCRLYDPTEGAILLNGIDITKYRYSEYLSLFSVVFQDFQLFQFSLAENVSGSDDYDAEKVEQSLVRAGFGERLRSLDCGIRSVIGRDYENDGIDLSGGEEQKIALARALYKDAPFVVLDEPTAALDPIAEAAVYENFQMLVKDKTAVFISHRLSSCRFCDDIIVFHKGNLVQRGNHDRLVEEEGKYRKLWNAQAKYYI